MNDQWWSWILTIVGLAGFILAGKKVWWCWYINIFAQILWFTYAIVTDQYGFIVASLAYTFVFTKNAIAWTKEHRSENEGWDFNEYTHLQEMIRDPEPHSFIITSNELRAMSAADLEVKVEAELQNWMYRMGINDRNKIVMYREPIIDDPGACKFTLEVQR